MATTFRFHICDVFTDRPFGGNPLAVFPDASGLDSELMRCIASEVGISKTAFVLPAETRSCTHRLRTFSPRGELPISFHAGIGTASVLAWLGDVAPVDGEKLRFVFEYGAIPLEVLMPIGQGDGAVVHVAAAELPRSGLSAPSIDRVATAISLQVSDLVNSRYSPQIIHSGLSCLFVPVQSLAALRRARLRFPTWQEISEEKRTGCACVFTLGAEGTDPDIRCRFFAPSLGVDEEPATGCAAAGIASYLAGRDPRKDASMTWRIGQGEEIGRPSRLEVAVEKVSGRLANMRLGGTAVYMGQGEFDLGLDHGHWDPPVVTDRFAVGGVLHTASLEH